MIDKITEDSFYENLLLGLLSVIRSCQFVSHIILERFEPATDDQVACWEAANELSLPEDLRNFFRSTNGFSFSYKFQYEKPESEENGTLTAGIEIYPLSKMEQVPINESMFLFDGRTKILEPYNKINLLSKIDDNNYVVLAQFNPSTPPNFWLYYKTKIFYFLCEDIVTYFRMALAHVGAPGWQLAVLKASLPEWSAELIQILAPGVFDNRRLFENKNELNRIDCDIFNTESDLQLTARSFREEQKVKVTPPANALKKTTVSKAKPKK